MPLVNAAILMGKISLGFSLFKIPRGHIVGFGRMFDTPVLEVISTEYVRHYLIVCEGSFANGNIAGCMQKADNFLLCVRTSCVNPPSPLVRIRTHLLDPPSPLHAYVLNE